nr:hypothetical protein [uncultured bacterium]
MGVYLQPHLRKDLVAQLAEHLPFKERVLGSSPSQVTNIKPDLNIWFYFLKMLILIKI